MKTTTDNKTLRIFASLLSLVASGWLLFYLYHYSASPITVAISLLIGLFFIIGLVSPQRLLRFYQVWTAGAEKLNQLVINSLLAIIFFILITPVALFRRSIGRDALKNPKCMANSTRQASTVITPEDMEQPY